MEAKITALNVPKLP